MIVYLLLALSLHSVAQGVPDNRGTEFVIGFPPPRSAGQNAYLNVTTSKPHDITVCVTAPRFPEANLNETFVVRQGLVIDVTVSHLLRGSDDHEKRLESKAIQITGMLVVKMAVVLGLRERAFKREIAVSSVNGDDREFETFFTVKNVTMVLHDIYATDEIIVYATYEINWHIYSNYLAYPIDGAGKEYYLVNCYKGCTCNYVIAGLENSTNITTEYLESHSDGLKVLFETSAVESIVLNRFDTYQISGYGPFFLHVTSGANILLFSRIVTSEGLYIKTRNDDKVPVSEQTLPVETWGRTFIHHPYIAVRGISERAGLFCLRQGFLSINATDTYGLMFESRTVIEKGWNYIDIQPNQFLTLESTVTCMLVSFFNYDTARSSYNNAYPFYTLAPMEQFAAGYEFLVNTASHFSNTLALFAKRADFPGLRLDGEPLPIGTSSIEIYFRGESYLASYNQISNGVHSIRHMFPNVVFGSVVIGSSPGDIYVIPSGTRLSPVNTECTNSSQIIADGLDNDCDRAVDEELCNGEDEDNDGLIDEDCAANFCENDGTCMDEQCSACNCSIEYRGRNCGIVACTSNTCKNGGTCLELKSNTSCTCRPGYKGTYCETAPYHIGTSSVVPDQIFIYGEHTVILRCQFSTAQGYLYKIQWYSKETVVRRTSFLSSSEAQLHFITDEEITDFFDIGVEIYCTADVYEIGNDTSLEQSSPEIFRPLQIDLTPISIDKGEEASIPVTINIPFGCSSTSEDCSLQFELSNTTDLFAENKLTVGFKDTWTCDVEVNRGRGSRRVDALPIVRKIVLTSVNGMQFENERAVNLNVKTKVHGKAKSYWSKKFQAVLPVQIKDFSSRRRSYCYSHVDPHMRTFDGRSYENQHLDEFIMYFNREWQILIQTKTKRCNGNRATCSCSCTMKSGGDIFMISHCDTHRTQFLADKNKSLYVERIHANKYKVIFPNLLRVIVIVNVLSGYKYTMNIDIYPAPGDRNKVQGLCGNFNGDPSDDFVPRGSTDVTSEFNFAMSWSLVHTARQSESLQRSHVIQSTTRWNEGGLYCICPNGQVDENGVTICKENKRDLLLGDTPDKHIPIIAKPWINPDEIRQSNGVDKRDASTLDAMSYDEARSMCEIAFLDCPVYAERDKLQEINTDSYIDECAQDVAMTGDIEWAIPHCEALGSYFVTQLEIDEEFALSLDQGLVNDILCQMCPGNCGGHGTCTNCSCVCEEGYGTDACLVDLNKSPTLNEISPDGVCDIARGEDCRNIGVSGDGFVDNPECRMQIQKADITGYFGATATSATECSYLEFNEITVDIAATRRRRSIAEPVTVVAERYGFSISNNGLNFSDFQYVVVIDSTCQNATTDENGTLYVQMQPDFCYIARVCYKSGETTTDGCNRCVPTVSTFTWTTACEEPDEEANILLIYFASMAGAVLLAIAIALTASAVRKLHKTRRNSKVISQPPGRTSHSVMFVKRKVHPDIDVTYNRDRSGRP